jgi:hypothetical protein
MHVCTHWHMHALGKSSFLPYGLLPLRFICARKLWYGFRGLGNVSMSMESNPYSTLRRGSSRKCKLVLDLWGEKNQKTLRQEESDIAFNLNHNLRYKFTAEHRN